MGLSADEVTDFLKIILQSDRWTINNFINYLMQKKQFGAA